MTPPRFRYTFLLPVSAVIQWKAIYIYITVLLQFSSGTSSPHMMGCIKLWNFAGLTNFKFCSMISFHEWLNLRQNFSERSFPVRVIRLVDESVKQENDNQKGVNLFRRDILNTGNVYFISVYSWLPCEKFNDKIHLFQVFIQDQILKVVNHYLFIIFFRIYDKILFNL